MTRATHHSRWIPPNKTGRAIAGHLLRTHNVKAISLTGGEREMLVRCVTGYGGMSIGIRVKLAQLWGTHGSDVRKHRQVEPELLERLSA